MEVTLAQLAGQLGVELRGDGNVRVSAVAPLQEGRAGALSFLANPRYRQHLKTTRAAAVVLGEEDAADSPVPVLVSDNPYACYARAARILYPQETTPTGIHPAATVDSAARVDPGAWIDAGSVVAAGARIGPAVQIGPRCVIGAGVVIGEGSRLVAGVTVLAAARIGRRVTLHPGAVIGSDGFGMAQTDGEWLKVPQLGSVCIGDDVDIGANTTVDRGALQDTVIEAGVKIDNQVQIGHNVFIGAHTAIAGCVGISGSTRIGRHCTLAGGVGLVGVFVAGI
ncbi:MAG: UDP-3-O-(3-hydroxymyristoyl)glucosamine N-acyltransferase [Thiogranum sp.]